MSKFMEQKRKLPEPKAMRATGAVPSNSITYVDTVADKEILRVDGSPFLYSGIQFSLARTAVRDHWSWSEMEKLFAAAADTGYTVFAVPIMWNRVEPQRDQWDWTDVDRSIDYALAYGLKLEILWFGHQVCSLSKVTESPPQYALDEYQLVVDQQGNEISVTGIDDLTGQMGTYYKLDMCDPNLLQRESYVMGQMMSHVSSYISQNQYPPVLVGVQVLNEPSAIFLYGYEPQLDRSYSSYANARWQAGGYTNVMDFNTDLLWQYLDRLAQTVKQSSWPVWTRVNFWDGWEGVDFVRAIIEKNEAARQAGTIHLDFIGNDPYVNSVDAVFNLMNDANMYAMGKNLPMVMENCGGNTNTDLLMLNAMAADGRYHVWELNDTLDNQCGIYTTDGYEIAPKPYQPSVLAMNSWLKKDWYGLAVLRAGGPCMKFLNRQSIQGYDTSGAVGGVCMRYRPTSTGSGIASAQGNQLVFMSTGEATWSLPSSYTVASLQTGHFDDANTWVSQGNVPYTAQGAETLFQASAYDCMRLVYSSVTTQNLALAASASINPGNVWVSAPGVNDGEVSTPYTSEQNPVLPQDLSLYWPAPQDFDRLVLRTYYAQGQGVHSFDVQVSDDGTSTFETVASVRNASYQYNDATMEQLVVQFDMVHGKQGLRLHMTGANLQWGHFAINELEVPKPNVAIAAVITADTANPQNTVSCAIDGFDMYPYASADGSPLPQNIVLSWPLGQSFSQFTMKTFYSQGQAPTAFTLYVSENGADTWQPVASASGLTYQYNDATIETTTLNFNPVSNVKAFKMNVTAANMAWGHFSINEIELQ